MSDLNVLQFHLMGLLFGFFCLFSWGFTGYGIRFMHVHGKINQAFVYGLAVGSFFFVLAWSAQNGIVTAWVAAGTALGLFFGLRINPERKSLGRPHRTRIIENTQAKLVCLQQKGGKMTWFTFYALAAVVAVFGVPVNGYLLLTRGVFVGIFSLIPLVLVFPALVLIGRFYHKTVFRMEVSSELQTFSFLNKKGIQTSYDFSAVEKVVLTRKIENDDICLIRALVYFGKRKRVVDEGTDGPYILNLAREISKRTGAPFDDLENGVEDDDD